MAKGSNWSVITGKSSGAIERVAAAYKPTVYIDSRSSKSVKGARVGQKVKLEGEVVSVEESKSKNKTAETSIRVEIKKIQK